MGEFAKKLHRGMASKADSLPTKEPKRRSGELLPGGIGPGGPKAWLTTIERS